MSNIERRNPGGEENQPVEEKKPIDPDQALVNTEKERWEQEKRAMQFDLEQALKGDMNPNQKEWKDMLDREKQKGVDGVEEKNNKKNQKKKKNK